MAGSIRERLATAASQLKEAGHYDSASAVEAVLAPRGYRLLQEKRVSTSTLALTIPASLKATLQAEAKEFGVVFSDLAEEAFREARDGNWVPPKKIRGTGGPMSVLNVRVEDELRQTVRGMLPELKERHGYPITESQIVLAYICEELGVERPNSMNTDRIRIKVPRPLADHFRVEAAKRGVDLQEVLEAGIRDLLDGSWQMPYSDGREVWTSQRDWASFAGERADVTVRVNAVLLEQLRQEAERLTVHTGRVVRAILMDRLGEPAE